jgi:hypothetical protein
MQMRLLPWLVNPCWRRPDNCSQSQLTTLLLGRLRALTDALSMRHALLWSLMEQRVDSTGFHLSIHWSLLQVKVKIMLRLTASLSRCRASVWGPWPLAGVWCAVPSLTRSYKWQSVGRFLLLRVKWKLCTTDDQSACLSWCQIPIWCPWPDFITARQLRVCWLLTCGHSLLPEDRSVVYLNCKPKSCCNWWSVSQSVCSALDGIVRNLI